MKTLVYDKWLVNVKFQSLRSITHRIVALFLYGQTQKNNWFNHSENKWKCVYTQRSQWQFVFFLPCVFGKYLWMLVVEWFHFCRFHAWNSLQLFKSFASNGSHRVAFVRNVTSIIFRSQLANYLYYMTINMNTKLPIDSIVAIQNKKIKKNRFVENFDNLAQSSCHSHSCT